MTSPSATTESPRNASFSISAGAGVKLRSEIARCRSELEQAIKAQEFEKAAELRDHIRELEKSSEAHDVNGRKE